MSYGRDYPATHHSRVKLAMLGLCVVLIAAMGPASGECWHLYYNPVDPPQSRQDWLTVAEAPGPGYPYVRSPLDDAICPTWDQANQRLDYLRVTGGAPNALPWTNACDKNYSLWVDRRIEPPNYTVVYGRTQPRGYTMTQARCGCCDTCWNRADPTGQLALSGDCRTVQLSSGGLVVLGPNGRFSPGGPIQLAGPGKTVIDIPGLGPETAAIPPFYPPDPFIDPVPGANQGVDETTVVTPSGEVLFIKPGQAPRTYEPATTPIWASPPPEQTAQRSPPNSPEGTWVTIHEHKGCTHKRDFCKRYDNHPVVFHALREGRMTADSGTRGTKLSGNLRGNRFDFTYNAGSPGKGYFVFSPDYETFRGRFEDEAGHRGDWTGRRKY